MTAIRVRTFVVPVVLVGVVAFCLLALGGARADGPPDLITAADLPTFEEPAPVATPALADNGLAEDLPRWWRSGALAGPIALGVYGLLALGRMLSRTRWPGLGWLRRGKVQGVIALVAGAMAGAIVPLAVSGSLTGPGLFSAMTAVAFTLPAGGGTKSSDSQPSRKLPMTRVVRDGGVLRLVDETTGDVLAEGVEKCEAAS